MLPVSEFTKFIGSMCARKMLNVYQLGPRLGIEPDELLAMINGRKATPPRIVQGLARELNIDDRYLERLAAEVRERLRNQDQ
jgi:hypothetical protein